MESRSTIESDSSPAPSLTPYGVIPVEEARRLAEMFHLFADATRARILYALLESKELRVTDISTALQVPETSVSHALRLLRMAGVVKNRRDGRSIYYRLHDEHIGMLLTTTRAHLAHLVR